MKGRHILWVLYRRIFGWASKVIKRFKRGHTVDTVFIINETPSRKDICGSGMENDFERLKRVCRFSDQAERTIKRCDGAEITGRLTFWMLQCRSSGWTESTRLVSLRTSMLNCCKRLMRERWLWCTHGVVSHDGLSSGMNKSLPMFGRYRIIFVQGAVARPQRRGIWCSNEPRRYGIFFCDVNARWCNSGSEIWLWGNVRCHRDEKGMYRLGGKQQNIWSSESYVRNAAVVQMSRNSCWSGHIRNLKLRALSGNSIDLSWEQGAGVRVDWPRAV